jgi:hypothetical protein
MNDWTTLNGHPSLMANSTSNKKEYGSLAVTALGNAFAVIRQDGSPDSIEYWRVLDNTVDWSLVGNVNLGNIWA